MIGLTGFPVTSSTICLTDPASKYQKIKSSVIIIASVLTVSPLVFKCFEVDLNHRHPTYQIGALTPELPKRVTTMIAHIVIKIKRLPITSSIGFDPSAIDRFVGCLYLNDPH